MVAQRQLYLKVKKGWPSPVHQSLFTSNSKTGNVFFSIVLIVILILVKSLNLTLHLFTIPFLSISNISMALPVTPAVQ